MSQDVSRDQKLADLRELIDWLEANPEVPLPDEPKLSVMLYPEYQFSSEEADSQVASVKAFAKAVDRDGDYDLAGRHVQITKRFGSASIALVVAKEGVGKNRMVAREVEVEEWDFPFKIWRPVAEGSDKKAAFTRFAQKEAA